jgi:hypothetical protein
MKGLAETLLFLALVSSVAANAKCWPIDDPVFYRDKILNSPPAAGSYNVFVKATPDCPVDHYVRCWMPDRAAFIGAKGATQPPECNQPH